MVCFIEINIIKKRRKNESKSNFHEKALIIHGVITYNLTLKSDSHLPKKIVLFASMKSL